MLSLAKAQAVKKPKGCWPQRQEPGDIRTSWRVTQGTHDKKPHEYSHNFKLHESGRNRLNSCG